MSVISDKEQIRQLKTTVAELESWIKLQETSMEWEVEERCEKKLTTEYNRGRSDGTAISNSPSQTIPKAMIELLQSHLNELLPKMIEEAIPEKYKNSFSNQIRATPRVEKMVNPENFTECVNAVIYFEPRRIAISQSISGW